jgi:hypothetical protein
MAIDMLLFHLIYSFIISEGSRFLLTFPAFSCEWRLIIWRVGWLKFSLLSLWSSGYSFALDDLLALLSDDDFDEDVTDPSALATILKNHRMTSIPNMYSPTAPMIQPKEIPMIPPSLMLAIEL